ncbi:MAG TPA: hypothetical protein ENK75_04515, partial [Saprospiraceae bacterium]|nr:hypothetical protein [Saprospiraceae bacterium]
MQKRSFSILVILLLWGNLAWTQQYINYTTKDGLPSNHIYRITQDSKGFMWFITDKGMSKFDGKIFKNFTTKEGLPTNDIWDIRTTPDGKVWFFSKASQLGYIKNDSVFSFKSIDKNDILYPIGILQYKNEVGFSNGQNAYFLEDSKWIKQKQTKDKDHYGELIIHPFIKEIIINDKYGTLELINHEHKLEKTFKKLGAINENLYKTQINDSLYIWINDTEFTLLNLNSLQIQSHTFNGMK